MQKKKMRKKKKKELDIFTYYRCEAYIQLHKIAIIKNIKDILQYLVNIEIYIRNSGKHLSECL